MVALSTRYPGNEIAGAIARSKLLRMNSGLESAERFAPSLFRREVRLAQDGLTGGVDYVGFRQNLGRFVQVRSSMFPRVS